MLTSPNPIDALLPLVEKPSRYLGKELNTVHKNPRDVEFRVCLFFPDLYELGLGNLGLHILYAILNDLDYVWAERGYTPAPDMEALLRERGLPLFLHESKDPLSAADLIGFTMQSELTFTNILNAIDLAGLPLRSEHRGEDAPLLFAGGPAVFNPEPLAPFIDFFVIGDGEDAVLELMETLRPLQHASKREKLEALSQLEGFYVPALYPFEELPDGQILPKEDAPKIVKRLARDLDGARFPTNYIVPYTKLVHDGIGLEVLRGCTQGCRFCQAGMVTRPVRERSMKNVDKLMEETLNNTGYEAVSLVSLSTCDFSRPRTLVKQAAERAHKDHVSVSLPSLRLDSFAVEMADMVSGVRRSGLTFAPEAATPRLRAVINKFIPDEELLNMSAEAFKRGWNSVKTYFMIGLPTERDEDVLAIADLCVRVLEQGKQIKRKAAVRTGVSTFVPKPFTPFQWAEQIGMEETHRKQNLLSDRFRGHPAIKFGRHDAKTSFIEGLLTRADRRAADLLEAAWRNGARLETWDEHVNFAAWEKAIEETNYDVAFQFRERDPEERLPWDHIDVLIPKKWFQQDWQNAMELRYAQDCRAGKCHLCGVIYRERELCKHMIKNQKQGHKEEAEIWGDQGLSPEKRDCPQRSESPENRDCPQRSESPSEDGTVPVFSSSDCGAGVPPASPDCAAGISPASQELSGEGRVRVPARRLEQTFLPEVPVRQPAPHPTPLLPAGPGRGDRTDQVPSSEARARVPARRLADYTAPACKSATDPNGVDSYKAVPQGGLLEKPEASKPLAGGKRRVTPGGSPQDLHPEGMVDQLTDGTDVSAGQGQSPTRELAGDSPCRIRFRIGRTGEVRLLSHLEVKDAWVRALRRAKAPIAYTQGFHEHPRVNFATASPVGEESCADYMDVMLTEERDPAELLRALQATLPAGFHAHEAEPMPWRAASLMSQVAGYIYTLTFPGDSVEVGTTCTDLLARDEIAIARRTKGDKKGRGRGNNGRAKENGNSINLRPMIRRLEARETGDGQVEVLFETEAIAGKLAKPKDIIALLELPPERVRVFKQETLLTEALTAK